MPLPINGSPDVFDEPGSAGTRERRWLAGERPTEDRPDAQFLDVRVVIAVIPGRGVPCATVYMRCAHVAAPVRVVSCWGEYADHLARTGADDHSDPARTAAEFLLAQLRMSEVRCACSTLPLAEHPAW